MSTCVCIDLGSLSEVLDSKDVVYFLLCEEFYIVSSRSHRGGETVTHMRTFCMAVRE